MGQVCGKSDKNIVKVKPEKHPNRRQTMISPTQPRKELRKNSETITVWQEGNKRTTSPVESMKSYCSSYAESAYEETGGDWSNGFREDIMQGYIPNPEITGGKIEEK